MLGGWKAMKSILFWPMSCYFDLSTHLYTYIEPVSYFVSFILINNFNYSILPRSDGTEKCSTRDFNVSLKVVHQMLSTSFSCTWPATIGQRASMFKLLRLLSTRMRCNELKPWFQGWVNKWMYSKPAINWLIINFGILTGFDMSCLPGNSRCPDNTMYLISAVAIWKSMSFQCANCYIFFLFIFSWSNIVPNYASSLLYTEFS